MTAEEAIAVFSSYSPDERKEFVAQLMYELTLAAGDTYEVGDDGLADAERGRHVNRMEQRVSAFLWSLLRNDSRRYPDDVFVRIILGWDEDNPFSAQLKEIYERLAAQRSAPAWQAFLKARKCS